VSEEPFVTVRWKGEEPEDSTGTRNYLAVNGPGLDVGSWSKLDSSGRDAGGVVRAVGYVLEQEPVQINSQLTAQAIAFGQSLTLSVAASGAAPLTYQWRRNGVAISGATAATHTISGAQASSEGSYDVVVANPCGSLASNTAFISVNTPVTITSQPVGVQVNPNAGFQLSVAASGTGPFTYQWRRDGGEVAGGTASSLAIGSAQASDAGAYQVVVTNAVSSATSGVATVALNVPLTITSHPLGAVLNPTGSVTLSIGVTGTFPASYQWRKDGVPISGATAATYTVAATQVSGAATYDVVATNVVGSVSSNPAVVSVNSPVTILEHPVALSVNPGAVAVFRVEAIGTSPLTYQWRRNGVAIAGANASSYTLSAAEAASAGNFDVLVSNVVGSVASSSAALSFNVPVSITAQPAGGALNAGATSTLSVTATGTNPLTYQWFRNGEAIEGATARTYTIGNAQPADAGVYQVAISNPVGTVASAQAAVTLNAVPTVVLQPLPVNVNPGAAASFNVTAEGTAPLRYQWRRDGVPISGATAATYSIAAAQASHAGSYDVVVTNVAGNAVSGAVPLELNVPIRITTQPGSIALNPGGSTMLSVVVEGTGPIAYQWRRNGLPIDGALGSSYVISAATEADVGGYEVLVTNVVGSVTSSRAQVSLNAPVVFLQHPAGLSVNPGATATFSAVVSGTAPFTYQWTKDGSPVPGATGAALVLSGVQAVDSGSYAVVVGNPVGSLSSVAASLSVNTPATIDTQPQGALIKPGDSLTLSVASSGTAPLSYQWYKNGIAIAGASSAGYAISGARDSDSADYTVAVSNIAGTVFSERAAVTVAVGVSIVTQPSSFTALLGGTTTLSLTTAGTGPIAYQWRKSGVDIPGDAGKGSSLVLSPVQATDAATYDVLVSNVLNAVRSNPVTVVVQDPVKIATQPLSPAGPVKAGKSFSFTAAASGTGPLFFQWRKDAVPLPGANSATYSVAMLDESYAGSYDVVVTGPWNSVVSAPATLTIKSLTDGPPVVMTHPVNTTVAWGKPATLSAMVCSREPFRYEWVRTGTNAVVARGDSGPATGLVIKYTVAAVKDSDEGLYELKLIGANGQANDTTDPAAIRLNMAFGEARLLRGTWKMDLSQVQTDASATVVLPSSVPPNDMLSVGIKTAAPATFSWIHRSGIGTVTRLTSQTGPVLNFKDVVRLRGFYVLTVTAGGTSRSITFQALSFASQSSATAPPDVSGVTFLTPSLTVSVGGAADFAVTASGSIAGYRWWRKKGAVETQLVNVGFSPWLTIDSVTLDDDNTEYFVEVLSAVPGAQPVRSPLPNASLDVVAVGD
jgi:hypothetical protein